MSEERGTNWTGRRKPKLKKWPSFAQVSLITPNSSRNGQRNGGTCKPETWIRGPPVTFQLDELIFIALWHTENKPNNPRNPTRPESQHHRKSTAVRLPKGESALPLLQRNSPLGTYLVFWILGWVPSSSMVPLMLSAKYLAQESPYLFGWDSDS